MKKTNNKGFSLVELIIVIAIMAILIGVLAPQYIKYVEKSRVSADKDLLDSVYKACATAASDPEIIDGSVPTGSSAIENIKGSNQFEAAVLATLGVDDGDKVNDKLKSKSTKNHDINFLIDANGNVCVWATGDNNSSIRVPAE